MANLRDRELLLLLPEPGTVPCNKTPWLKRGLGTSVKYYLYFDVYGNARRAISEEELTEKYNGDPYEFLKAMCVSGPEREGEYAGGNVIVRGFENEKELNDFLESLGDEVEGFYACRSGSRPYNF